MALDPGVVLLVLLAAVLHASWNALVKTGEDAFVILALATCTPGVLAALALPFVPVPEAASVPFLLASIVIHFAYYATLIYAYRHGDLSQVYPIARGTAPVLVAGGAWIFAGEALDTLEIAGVMVVSAGIISLAWRRGPPGDTETKAIVFALLTSLAIGGYTVCDGMGVRRAGSQLGYILWLFAVEALPMTLLIIWLRHGKIRISLARSGKSGVGAGIVAGLAYGIVIWAMGLGPMAHIIALRETSVVFAAAIGAFLLKEPFGCYRMTAAGLVATGAVLLQLG